MAKTLLESRVSAEAMQDELFRRMSAEKKIKLSAALTALCLKLNRLNVHRASRKTSR